MIPSIDVDKLRASLKEITLLDVRRKADYEASPKKIPGAAWLDPDAVDTWIGKQSKDRSTIVYCVKGGGVSQSIAERMNQRGIDTAFLKGGINAWTERGESLE